ncbi:hypothetical protein [Haloarcula sp. H-GB5]
MTAHDGDEYKPESELKATDEQDNTNAVERKEATEHLRDLGYL